MVWDFRQGEMKKGVIWGFFFFDQIKFGIARTRTYSNAVRGNPFNLMELAKSLFLILLIGVIYVKANPGSVLFVIVQLYNVKRIFYSKFIEVGVVSTNRDVFKKQTITYEVVFAGCF